MINTRPPKNYTEGRDFERWMYNLSHKLGTSDMTFDELAAIVTSLPATTVVPETAYGLAPAVGVSTLYARGDHTHGTPSDEMAIAFAITLG